MTKRTSTFFSIGGLALLALVVIGGSMILPDVKRYIRMRNM
jgi:hypothetical protein